MSQSNSLNELREILIGKYPGRAVYVSANCNYNPENTSLPQRRTTFLATIFKSNSEIDCQVEANTPEELVSLVSIKLSPRADKEVMVASDCVPGE